MSTTILPLTSTTTLFEPSFVDLIAEIERSRELSDDRRRHWVCSLRQIAKWLDRPATVIAARWSSVRLSVAQLHHARIGVTAKTLSNHKSNARAALRWFSQEHDLSQPGVRLSADWARFCDGVEKRLRDRLYNFMRYCSARGISPAAVDDEIFDEYWHYRNATTARACNNTARRFMVRAWNACAATSHGQSLRSLAEPPVKVTEPAWEAFPEGLRRGLDDYFAGLAQVTPHAQRQAHPALQPVNARDASSRACRDGAHGGAARRGDRKPHLFGSATPPRPGRKDH
jgi:hypothetical protein